MPYIEVGLIDISMTTHPAVSLYAYYGNYVGITNYIYIKVLSIKNVSEIINY